MRPLLSTFLTTKISSAGYRLKQKIPWKLNYGSTVVVHLKSVYMRVHEPDPKQRVLNFFDD